MLNGSPLLPCQQSLLVCPSLSCTLFSIILPKVKLILTVLPCSSLVVNEIEQNLIKYNKAHATNNLIKYNSFPYDSRPPKYDPPSFFLVLSLLFSYISIACPLVQSNKFSTLHCFFAFILTSFSAWLGCLTPHLYPLKYYPFSNIQLL